MAQNDSLVAQVVSELELLGSEAVSSLRLTLSCDEPGPRVRAAEAILDRIGVPREAKLSGGSSLPIPPEMLMTMIGGLASMMGKKISESDLERARESIRNVTPEPAEEPARRAGSAPPISVSHETMAIPEDASPEPREDARRRRGRPKKASSVAVNIPLEVIEEMEDELED